MSRAQPSTELQAVASICGRHDPIAVCDEVWEYVGFDGRAHQPLIAVPGMHGRTLKIRSAGRRR